MRLSPAFKFDALRGCLELRAGFSVRWEKSASELYTKFLRVETRNMARLFFMATWKKSEVSLLYFSFFSFSRLNFTMFRDFSATLILLTDARKKRPVFLSFRIAMKSNHAIFLFSILKNPRAKQCIAYKPLCFRLARPSSLSLIDTRTRQDATTPPPAIKRAPDVAFKELQARLRVGALGTEALRPMHEADREKKKKKKKTMRCFLPGTYDREKEGHRSAPVHRCC